MYHQQQSKSFSIFFFLSFFILSLIVSAVATAEPWFDSNLDVLIIQTNNEGITPEGPSSMPDAPKQHARLWAFSASAGGVISDTQDFLSRKQVFDLDPTHTSEYSNNLFDFDGNILIEERGSSSTIYPQRNFLIQLKSPKNVAEFLGMVGGEGTNRWSLEGLYPDRSVCFKNKTNEKKKIEPNQTKPKQNKTKKKLKQNTTALQELALLSSRYSNERGPIRKVFCSSISLCRSFRYPEYSLWFFPDFF